MQELQCIVMFLFTSVFKIWIGGLCLYYKSKLVPPGLPDIKWNELYSKLGKFVPEHRKAGLKYFLKKSPESLKKAIAKQSAEAKQAHAQRTRDGGKKAPSKTPTATLPTALKVTKKRRGQPSK
jgi:hypothetical protein